MTKHVLDPNGHMTWYVTTSNDTWLVRKGAKFQVYNGDGISDTSAQHDSHFQIDGQITALDGEGLDLYGRNDTVLVGASGRITTAHGFGIAFESAAYNGHLENHGTITSDFSGVSMTGASPAGHHQSTAEIVNYGRITAGEQNGIYSSSDDLTITNKHGALISGGQYGYGITSVENDVTVINSGTIKGSYQGAIGLNSGNDTVINSGKIIGDVKLNNGNDTYIDKGGSVSGVINAGVGADTYIISHKGLKLHEDDFSDIDTVRASISWTLGDNFEKLVLTGTHKINGTGTADADRIIGNSRQNVITGLGGDDVLKGGGGADRFVFRAGSGHDMITDFKDGADRINLSHYDTIDRFKDIGIAKSGHDTLLTLANGDTILLQHVSTHDISAGDFIF